jgi:hypothetical protein
MAGDSKRHHEIEGPGSMRQPHKAHKLFEPWIRAERIEARPLQHAWIKSLFVAFPEPIHGLIGFAKSCVDHRNLHSKRMAGA